jgi:hypothetical protein
MHSNPNAMEITLHLSDGRLVPFSQPEDGQAGDLFEGVPLSDVFKRKILILRADQSVSLFQTDKIVRIDVSRLDPGSCFWDDQVQADQIADYDFQWLQETLTAVKNQFPEKRRIDDVIVAADVELVNSEHLFLRVEFHTSDPTNTPQDLFLDQILNAGGLMVRLREGGFSIINPKSLVRLTFCPAPDRFKVAQAVKATG